MERDSKIYIAGHTGLVGSVILRNLQSQGYGNVLLRTHNELDLEAQKDVNEFFEREKPEYVFLAAAKVGGIHANSTCPAEFIYNNLMIQNNVVHSAYLFGVKKLLFLGSSCIYPQLAPQPMKEEYLLSGPLEPTNEPYAIAKIAGIKLCQSYNRQYGTNFISVMPTNLYGPNDNYDLMDSHVLPALIRKFHLAKLLSQGRFDDIVKDFKHFGNSPDFVHGSGYLGVKDCLLPTAYSLIVDHLSKFGIKLSSSCGLKSVSFPKSDIDNSLPTAYCPVLPVSKGVTVELWGTGEPYREFLHVDDLADACVFLMERYGYQDIGGIINIGVGKDQKIRELAERVREVVRYNGAVEYDDSKPDGTPRKLLNVTRLQNLGWSPKISIEEGIKNTYNWYCDFSSKIQA